MNKIQKQFLETKRKLEITEMARLRTENNIYKQKDEIV